MPIRIRATLVQMTPVGKTSPWSSIRPWTSGALILTDFTSERFGYPVFRTLIVCTGSELQLAAQLFSAVKGKCNNRSLTYV